MFIDCFDSVDYLNLKFSNIDKINYLKFFVEGLVVVIIKGFLFILENIIW